MTQRVTWPWASAILAACGTTWGVAVVLGSIVMATRGAPSLWEWIVSFAVVMVVPFTAMAFCVLWPTLRVGCRLWRSDDLRARVWLAVLAAPLQLCALLVAGRVLWGNWPGQRPSLASGLVGLGGLGLALLGAFLAGGLIAAAIGPMRPDRASKPSQLPERA